MTNTRDKFSGGGGDLAPSPRSPASSRDGKKTQKTASVPIENCLTVGVQSGILGPTWVQNSGQLAPFSSLSSGRATESTRFMERAMGIEPTSTSG